MGLQNTARELARAEIDRRGYSGLRELATDMGVSRQALDQWLKGKNESMRLQYARPLARILEIPVAAVLVGDTRICDLTRVETDEPDSAA